MIENFLKKKYAVSVALAVIMLLAFVVRFYHFHEWLYFKMDQARDAFTISNAVLNGPGNLPLLGARAGATQVTYGFLNLGPIFYYFQYLSGIIFHSTSPEVFAYPDLFFGVMVLPLLYLLMRIYFNKQISLLIVLMYAFSFLIIQYSRFAWNPNSLPFFTILSFLALLRFLNYGNAKHRKWWLILWVTGLAVGSQLHFVGFFSLVGVSGLMFLYHYKLWKKEIIASIFKKINIKKIISFSSLALFVFLIFYTPVIISDSKKNWENSKNFIEALSSKPSDNTLLEKFTENISQEARYYTLIATAYVYNPQKINSKETLPVVFTIAIFLFGIYLAIWKIRKAETQKQKDFLMLVLLWFFVYFILCIPLAYSIRPRFFIFTFALPFIFAGLVMNYLCEEKRIKYGKLAALLLFLIILVGNIWGTADWFGEQVLSQERNLTIKRTFILKNKDGVTLGQLERATDFISSRMKKDNRAYYYIKSEHVRPSRYLLFEKNPKLAVNQLKITDDPKAQYFAIVPADYKTDDVFKKVGREYDLISEKQCGQIKVLEINFPGRTISNNFSINQAQTDSGPGRRLFWRDVFGSKLTSDSIDNGIETLQEIQETAQEESAE